MYIIGWTLVVFAIYLVIKYVPKWDKSSPYLKATIAIAAFGILFLFGGLATGGNNSHTSARNSTENSEKIKHNGITAYPLKITSVKYKEDRLVISGTTKAPDKAKVYILTYDNESNEWNDFASSELSNGDPSWPRIKNHKFTAGVDLSDATSLAPKEGDKVKIKAVAITGYKSSWESDPDNSNKAVKALKKIKPTPHSYKLTAEESAYFKNKDNSGSGKDTDSSDSSNSEVMSASDKSAKDESASDVSQYQSSSSSSNANSINTADQGTIVGNSNTHVYHTPGQAGYNMNASNAVYFNTESEAQAAGYRKSLR